jgi:bifunctional non-homologous end joining protein LigD
MTLQKYIRKRKFNETTEPVGNTKAGKKQLSFVVQRHKASRLHYDFRLEAGGVLKSWAVPKGPSMNPADKRLAILVEDHPYDYKDFKGVIPKGNYGAGIVEIWDKGFYTDITESDKKITEAKIEAGLKAGDLKFRLHGKKLKGEFALVRMKDRGENAWLLIKHKDQYSVSKPYDSENFTPANSAINKQQAKPKEKKVRKKLSVIDHNEKLPEKSGRLTKSVKPMLANEADKAFDDPGWVFEIKWDGYRAICILENEQVELYSRNGKLFNKNYPVLLPELRKIKDYAVLDGEIVALNKDGIPDFQLLQNYDKDNSPLLQYCVFDLLSLHKTNTCDLPLLQRKALLKRLLGKGNLIRYCDHVKEVGKSFFKATLKKNLEGMMAKKIDSLYSPGQRTSSWLKIKHHKSDEFLIAGYTKGKGARNYFGALVLGRWKEHVFTYVGHTGSGFNEKSLSDIFKQLQKYISRDSPFSERVPTNAPVVWLRPQLVCEVKFTGWTQDLKLRHPVFLRLRPDKTIAPEKLSRKASNTMKNKEDEFDLNVKGIEVSHPDKLFWPVEGVTKADLIKYYQQISGFILPYLKDRPESLKRNPNGISDKGFYQKDFTADIPKWAKTIKIYSQSAEKDIHYFVCNNPNSLAYLNNLGCIEFNPWHSSIQYLDYPDYLVLDIDPGEENSFKQVVEVAHVIHDILEGLKVPNFCKTSGASGMHVFVPTAKKYTYDQLKEFSQLICILVRDQLPEFTTMERNLQKRGKKHIYLDYLQNRKGQTIASAYSVRPYPRATVSTPLLWKEVKANMSPSVYTIHTVPERLKKTGDVFKGVLGKGIDLRKTIRLLDK